MSYAPKRPKISQATRDFIFARDNGICYLCTLPIDGNGPWEADHELARELGGPDDRTNLRPAHVLCHRLKTKADVKTIAKSNRIRKKHGLDPIRRKPRKLIASRPFQKSPRKLPSRSMRKEYHVH